MITYDKILVCLDLSDTDKSVIKSACEIAKVTQATHVSFINVIKDFNLPDSLISEFPHLVDQAIAERKEQLQKSINTLFDCGNIATDLVIKQGNETKEILSASLDIGADLIVQGIKKGSNSVLNTRIVRRAACNILLVPESTDLKLEKIHVPVDFSNYSLLSLNTALSITGNHSAEIFLQNVYNVPSSYRYSGKTFEEFAKIMEDNSKKDLGGLVKQASVKNQKLEAIHSLDNGQNVIKMVFNEASKGNADLIVMGTKGRTAASALFIGSKAERMIQINDSIPLLVVRQKGSNAGILESLKDL